MCRRRVFLFRLLELSTEIPFSYKHSTCSCAHLHSCETSERLARSLQTHPRPPPSLHPVPAARKQNRDATLRMGDGESEVSRQARPDLDCGSHPCTSCVSVPAPAGGLSRMHGTPARRSTSCRIKYITSRAQTRSWRRICRSTATIRSSGLLLARTLY